MSRFPFIEYVPEVAAGAIGFFVGREVYDDVLGPQLLDTFGLGALHSFGGYVELGTQVGLGFLVLYIFDKLQSR